MTNSFLCLFVAVSSGAVGQTTQDRAALDSGTSVASALSWYHQWQTHNKTVVLQSCEGLFLNGIYVLDCRPLEVTLVVKVDVNGFCQITVMRFSGRVPDLSANTDDQRPYRTPRNCSGLPKQGGPFAISIEPKVGKVDVELSKQARDSAIEYLHIWKQRCHALFPMVRYGDPFFHVYLECGAALDYVLEFAVTKGQPGNVPHWWYTRSGKNLPEGAKMRLSRQALWLGSSWIGRSGVPKKHPEAR